MRRYNVTSESTGGSKLQLTDMKLAAMSLDGIEFVKIADDGSELWSWKISPSNIKTLRMERIDHAD